MRRLERTGAKTAKTSGKKLLSPSGEVFQTPKPGPRASRTEELSALLQVYGHSSRSFAQYEDGILCAKGSL